KLVLREPGPFVELHPEDAGRLDVAEGDLVQLSSRRGTIQLPARLSDGVSPGMVFVPFHWGDLFAPDTAPNYWTISAIGRVAKQPELKFCAVALEKVPCSRDPERSAGERVESPMAPARSPALRSGSRLSSEAVT